MHVSCSTHASYMILLKYKRKLFLFQGLYQKAQALYYQGDFEMSLVFYHRGLKLRPELQEFRLGIQKAQEAIDNSVGCKLTGVVFPKPARKLSSTGSSVFQRKRSSWNLDGTISNQSSKPSSHISSTNTSLSKPAGSKKGNKCVSHLRDIFILHCHFYLSGFLSFLSQFFWLLFLY